MNENKRPNWDKVEVHHAIKNFDPSNRLSFNDVHTPAKVGMKVDAHYKGMFVGLIIFEAITDTEFVAIVTSFGKPSEHFEDLSINQKVMISRNDIFGIEL